FLTAAFLTAVFLTAAFLATTFFATAFFTALFFTAAFLAGAFFTAAFFTAAFFTAVLAGAAFFAADFFTTAFLVAGAFAAFLVGLPVAPAATTLVAGEATVFFSAFLVAGVFFAAFFVAMRWLLVSGLSVDTTQYQATPSAYFPDEQPAHPEKQKPGSPPLEIRASRGACSGVLQSAPKPTTRKTWSPCHRCGRWPDQQHAWSPWLFSLSSA